MSEETIARIKAKALATLSEQEFPKTLAEQKNFIDLLSKLEPKEKDTDTNDELYLAVKTLIDAITEQIEAGEVGDLREELKEANERIKELTECLNKDRPSAE